MFMFFFTSNWLLPLNIATVHRKTFANRTVNMFQFFVKYLCIRVGEAKREGSVTTYKVSNKFCCVASVVTAY